MSRELAERGRCVRRLRNGAALLLASLGLLRATACRAERQPAAREPVEPLSQFFLPARTIVLRSDATDVPEPQFILQASPDELLVIMKRTQELWLLPLDAGRPPRRVGSFRGRRKSRIVGAAARAGSFALLDVSGTLWLHRARDPHAAAQRQLSVPRGTGPIALLSTADSTWLVAERRASVDPATRITRDSALVVSVTPGGRQDGEWGFERAGPSRPDAFFSDYIGATSYGDTIVVTGAEPARIISWVRGQPGTRREVPLLKVRRRSMSPADRSALATVARIVDVPVTRDAALREYYPPVVGARPDGAGWFVIAGAGAKNFALDYYCDRTFVETLLEHPTVTSITPLARAVVVVRREAAPRRVVVEYYPWSVFKRSCGQGDRFTPAAGAFPPRAAGGARPQWARRPSSPSEE